MKVLVLDDGNKGNLIQSLGIAKNFPDSEIEIYKVCLKGPSYSLPGRKGKYKIVSKAVSLFCLFKMWNIGMKVAEIFMEKCKIPEKKFDFVISAGSFLAPFNLLFSKKTGAKSINIMTPAIIPLSYFDIAIIPYHDSLKISTLPSNVIVSFGSLNVIDDEILEREKEKLVEKRGIPDGKKIGILIGGDDQNYRISVNWIEKFIDSLKKIKEDKKFLITTSKRTSKNTVKFLMEKISELENVFYAEFPGISEESHYFGILGISDILIVTEDSINMVSEAITAGKPTLIIGVERKREKRLIFDFTMEKFVEEGYADYLSFFEIDKLSERIKKIENRKFKKLNEAKRCAQKILEILK